MGRCGSHGKGVKVVEEVWQLSVDYEETMRCQ